MPLFPELDSLILERVGCFCKICGRGEDKTNTLATLNYTCTCCPWKWTFTVVLNVQQRESLLCATQTLIWP